MKKRVVTLLLLCAFVVGLIMPVNANAANASEDAKTVKHMDEIECKGKQAYWYKMVTEENGHIAVAHTGRSNASFKVYIYDEYLNELASGKISNYSYNSYPSSLSSENKKDVLEPGTYYIRIETDSSANYKFRFSFKPTGTLELCPTIEVGETLNLSALLTSASNKSFTWSSSDKKIATVSKSGTVKGKKAGTVTITVKNDGGLKSTLKIKVVN